MNSVCRNGPLGIVPSVAAMAALGQTATGTPNTVGVPPAATNEAIKKAVSRNDTGTVVRTTPSIASRASDAVSSSTNTEINTATGNPNAPLPHDTTLGVTGKPMRSARSDRN